MRFSFARPMTEPSPRSCGSGRTVMFAASGSDVVVTRSIRSAPTHDLDDSRCARFVRWLARALIRYAEVRSGELPVGRPSLICTDQDRRADGVIRQILDHHGVV